MLPVLTSASWVSVGSLSAFLIIFICAIERNESPKATTPIKKTTRNVLISEIHSEIIRMTQLNLFVVRRYMRNLAQMTKALQLWILQKYFSCISSVL